MQIKLFITLACCLLCLTGCKKAAESTVQETGSLPVAASQDATTVTAAPLAPTDVSSIPNSEQASETKIDSTSVSAQLKIIAENRPLWDVDAEFANEVHRYAVTDLDHNGRLELLVSHMGGTGLFTYTRFYEMNESYDTLVECETAFTEYDSQPDLIIESMETYMDDKGQCFYVVYDTMRNGAAEYYESTQFLTLKDGKILVTTIATRTTIYHDGSPEIVCKDGSGSLISESDYEQATNAYFSNMTHTITAFGWQDMLELADDASQLVSQLENSISGFGLVETP